MTTKEVAALAALAQKAIRITIEYWVWETNKKYRQRFFDQLSQIYTIRHQLIQYSYWRYQWWTCPELNIDPCKHQLKTLALRLLSFSSPNCVGICQVCHQHILFMTKVGDSVITECQSSSCGAFGRNEMDEYEDMSEYEEETSFVVHTDCGLFENTYSVHCIPKTKASTLVEAVSPFIRDGDVFIVDKFFYQEFQPLTLRFCILWMEATEENKNMATIESWFSQLPPSFSKSNRFVIIGGGITQDVGGFLAAIYKRGIPYLLCSTTFLAITDSCIGSKVCLNIMSSSAIHKNQLGLFCAPSMVIVPECVFSTMSEEMILCGLGEAFKLSLLAGEKQVDQFWKFYEKKDWMRIAQQSLWIKRAVIEKDEKEVHERKALNYGHTLGHVLESVTSFHIPHGIAVLWGMYLITCLFSIFRHDSSSLSVSLSETMKTVIQPQLWSLIPLEQKKWLFDYVQENFVLQNESWFSLWKEALQKDKKNKGSQIGWIVVLQPGICNFVWTEKEDIFPFLEKVLQDCLSRCEKDSLVKRDLRAVID